MWMELMNIPPKRIKYIKPFSFVQDTNSSQLFHVKVFLLWSQHNIATKKNK